MRHISLTGPVVTWGALGHCAGWPSSKVGTRSCHALGWRKARGDNDCSLRPKKKRPGYHHLSLFGLKSPQLLLSELGVGPHKATFPFLEWDPQRTHPQSPLRALLEPAQHTAHPSGRVASSSSSGHLASGELASRRRGSLGIWGLERLREPVWARPLGRRGAAAPGGAGGGRPRGRGGGCGPPPPPPHLSAVRIGRGGARQKAGPVPEQLRRKPA